MRNEKLTDVMKGREIQGGVGWKGTFTYNFTDGSRMTMENCRERSTLHHIAPLQAARQQDTRLILDFANGETLEVEFVEATSRVLVWDKNGVLEYAGGREAETWAVKLENEGDLVPETPEPEWRFWFRLAMESVEARISYLQDSISLPRRPARRQRPKESYWLTNLLSSLHRARRFLRLGEQTGEATEEEARRLRSAEELAQEGVREKLSGVRKRMRREFAELVRLYRRSDWTRAIEAGLAWEMSLDLMNRDSMETHLRAMEWLHPDLIPDPELVQVVERMDEVLRTDGPRLWEIYPPTTFPDERRALLHPREHWWWWLDHAGESDDAPNDRLGGQAVTE